MMRDVLDKPEEALALHSKAVELDPLSAGTIKNVGTDLEILGRFDEALAKYEKSIEVDPNYADGYWNIGRAPRAIGIDEISIRKGHNYRVIVSDLDRERPIWVGGEGRKEADIDLFFKALGEKKSARIELAAMDMWKAFRNSVMKNAPNARIIYDKFHIMRHLSKALDEVRRSEYKRLSGKDRSYIKGQRYTLLSRRKNLSLNGRRALKKLLEANRRLNTAYLLKETFGQLWDYRTERGARAFFERWQDSLKSQRLQPQSLPLDGLRAP